MHALLVYVCMYVWVIVKPDHTDWERRSQRHKAASCTAIKSNIVRMCAKDLMMRNENEKTGFLCSFSNVAFCACSHANDKRCWAEKIHQINSHLCVCAAMPTASYANVWVCVYMCVFGPLRSTSLCWNFCVYVWIGLWRYHTRTHQYLLSAFGQHMCTKCKHSTFLYARTYVCMYVFFNIILCVNMCVSMCTLTYLPCN